MTEYDSLFQFGVSFQIKTITCLLKDSKYLEQISDIVLPQYYDSDANKWIIRNILSYHQQYKNYPTLDVFKIELEKNDLPDILKKSIIENLRSVYQNMGATDLDYVKENFLNFAKNQAMKNAIIECADLINKGKLDGVRPIVDKALKAGESRELGVIYKDLEFFKRRVSETVRNTISTPWPIINEILDGGLGKGEMGVIVAPGGIGKTWALTCIGIAAANKGKIVLHYTLELSDDYIGLRYDSRLSGYPSQEIKFHQDDVLKEIGKVKGNVIIKHYPTKHATIDTIRAHITRCINFGFKPDMIIVDYGDLIKGNILYNAKEKRFELEGIYEELRGMAGEFEVPLWSASQSNRSSTEDEYIEANRISEAYSKVMISDFIMTLQRRTKDKLSHTGRIHVAKNRFGPDGFTYPAKINAANGTIEIFDEKTDTGQKIKKEMESGTLLERRLLNQKFEELIETPVKKVEGMG